MSRDEQPSAVSSEAERVDSFLRAVARVDDVDPPPIEGDVIGGNFCVESKLGAGGMGVVYLARDLRLHRRIALKVHSRADGAQRTEREARVLASVVHPNVVTIHDVGTWNGRTYIAMEYLDGGNLRAWLGARPRGWREILAIFLEAARGLEAMHLAGLVHRDFKPDNVLLGSDGRVRIADFGLARPVRMLTPDPDAKPRTAAPVSPIDAPLTATGACLGTPGYIAPEAERGDEVDARADQYSLCVALRAALAGHKAPRWIAAIVDRGLDPDPARRYISLAELVDAVERRLRGRRRWIAPALAAAGVIAAIALWMTSGTRAEVATPHVCPEPDLPMLHVDTAAAAGGNGSVACPFRTLSQALEVPASPRIVHVAAGRYDVEHGEKLPLVIRGDTEIRGAGAEITTIAGFGYFDPRPLGLVTPHPVRVALVVGDHRANVVLSGISLEGGQRENADGSVAILCTTGNLDAFEGPLPAPNTRLDHVIVGSGYEVGLIVTGGNTPRLTGCNLSVTASFFHHLSVGILQIGCGTAYTAAPVALDVTNSSFRAIRARPNVSNDAPRGAGIVVWDCARRVHVADSMFTESDKGITLTRHTVLQPNAGRDPDEPPAVFERNEFAALGELGIRLELAARAELVGNYVWGSPAGLIIHAASNEPPQVRARNNLFSGNAIAVDVTGKQELPRDSVIDFGRAGDPGGNQFNCNAVKGDPVAAAIAVQVRVAPQLSLDFVGNRWDHAPPRIRRRFQASSRAEVVLATGPADIDVGGASPTGHVCAKP
jgi:predicted Ser/Thr protein kinase